MGRNSLEYPESRPSSHPCRLFLLLTKRNLQAQGKVRHHDRHCYKLKLCAVRHGVSKNFKDLVPCARGCFVSRVAGPIAVDLGSIQIRPCDGDR